MVGGIRPARKPAGSAAQAQLILASRRAATRRQRTIGSTGVVMTVVMTVVMAALAALAPVIHRRSVSFSVDYF
jgi:hypothetical protein